jgi:hypothetical protein
VELKRAPIEMYQKIHHRLGLVSSFKANEREKKIKKKKKEGKNERKRKRKNPNAKLVELKNNTCAFDTYASTPQTISRLISRILSHASYLPPTSHPRPTHVPPTSHPRPALPSFPRPSHRLRHSFSCSLVHLRFACLKISMIRE